MVDPAEPRPGPLSWCLDGRPQGVTLWIRSGVWEGINANTHPKEVALRLQQPTPVFVAEERHLDAEPRELGLQVVAQGVSYHSFVDEFLVLPLENGKFFPLDQEAGWVGVGEKAFTSHR